MKAAGWIGTGVALVAILASGCGSPSRMNSNQGIEMGIAKAEGSTRGPAEVGSTSSGSGMGAGVPPGNPASYGAPEPPKPDAAAAGEAPVRP